MGLKANNIDIKNPSKEDIEEALKQLKAGESMQLEALGMKINVISNGNERYSIEQITGKTRECSDGLGYNHVLALLRLFSDPVPEKPQRRLIRKLTTFEKIRILLAFILVASLIYTLI